MLLSNFLGKTDGLGTKPLLLSFAFMKRFFFHARTRLGYVSDLEGQELPDLKAAEIEAKTAARELVANMLVHDEPLDGEQFEIADAVGTHLMTVRWADAVEFEDVYLD